MTKRLFAVLLASLLILMSFTACGTKTPEPGTTATEDTSAAETEANAQTSAEETAASSEAASESAEPSTAQSAQKPTSNKPASKPATTAKSNNSGSSSKGKLEVSAASVKSVTGAKVLRAWKLNSNGVNIEIHRIAYGAQITQAFKKANADGAIDYDKTVTYQPVVNVAIITCSPDHIGVASSQQLLGTNVGKVEDMGRKSGALIAINGEDGSTYKRGAPTIRSGSVISTDGQGQKRLLIYKNGTWKVETLTNENYKSYISQGVYNSLRYQRQVITNGKATNEHDTYYHNRTVFAQISENKYIMAIGEFMPLDNMMKVLIAYGARNAFLLNGGNCSSMYVKGIGNTTGTKATQLKNLNKPCVIESEFFAANGMLGLNSAGKQKLGGPCNELDIVYVK
ncbi:MAG: phosphodiester glycosidase family protein [Oscillospiraceae bacterium]|nr:phosphodiester glycosidase family protein [Oscillospiraceae bacterium]